MGVDPFRRTDAARPRHALRPTHPLGDNTLERIRTSSLTIIPATAVALSLTLTRALALAQAPALSLTLPPTLTR